MHVALLSIHLVTVTLVVGVASWMSLIRFPSIHVVVQTRVVCIGGFGLFPQRVCESSWQFMHSLSPVHSPQSILFLGGSVWVLVVVLVCKFLVFGVVVVRGAGRSFGRGFYVCVVVCSYIFISGA